MNTVFYANDVPSELNIIPYISIYHFVTRNITTYGPLIVGSYDMVFVLS